MRPGLNFGETDEFGYFVTNDEVMVRDLQATILHLLGRNPQRLSYPYLGLDQRLIEHEGKARVRN